MKNFKAISMDCNEQQFESMREELIELGCDIDDITDFDDGYTFLCTNYGGNLNHITNLEETSKANRGRTYIGAFDKEAFLKACGKVEEVKGLPAKWCVKHSTEALDWIRKNAELNGEYIKERAFYMMPSNSDKNNSSDFEPEGYTIISEQQFKEFVLKEKTEVKESGWYGSTNGSKWMMYIDFEKDTKFGLEPAGVWRLDSDSDFGNATKATNEEVLQRLTEEADKRGYKEGVIIDNSNLGFEDRRKITKEIKPNQSRVIDDFFILGNWVIMKNGIWADIVADEIEVVEPVNVSEIESLKEEKTSLLKYRNRYKQLYKQEKELKEGSIKETNEVYKSYCDQKESREELYKIGIQLGSENDKLKKDIKQTNRLFWTVLSISIAYVIFTLC